MNFSSLFQLPVWVGGLFYLGVLLAALEFGYRAGLRQRDQWKDVDDGCGNLVLTSILALLGLILAFTFASGVSHYGDRKQAVIAEANALGTAFLRADLAANPGRTELKRALLDYARTRAVKVGKPFSAEQLRELVQKSSQAKAKLWPVTQQILKQNQPGPMEASLVVAVNDVIDFHAIRIASVFDQLPRIVLLLVVFITSASLAVAGFNAGV